MPRHRSGAKHIFSRMLLVSQSCCNKFHRPSRSHTRNMFPAVPEPQDQHHVGRAKLLPEAPGASSRLFLLLAASFQPLLQTSPPSYKGDDHSSIIFRSNPLHLSKAGHGTWARAGQAPGRCDFTAEAETLQGFRIPSC